MMKKLFLFLMPALLFLSGREVSAQTARTVYFMDGVPVRLQLNPALQPGRGFLSLPVVGALGVSVISDPLTADDVLDILDQKNGFLQDEGFLGKLKTDNTVNLDLHTDVLSFGFYSGKGFWSVRLGTKFIFSASLPGSLFEFARLSSDVSSWADDWGNHVGDLAGAAATAAQGFDIRNLRVDADVFTELGVGYSRPVGNRLVLGGSLKFLAGLGNLEACMEQLAVKPGLDSENRSLSWQVTGKGHVDVSVKGLELEHSGVSGDDYISDADADFSGVGGYGAGVDLGAVFKVSERLSLSAAVTDLGFVRWSGSASVSAGVDRTYRYEAGEDGTEILDLDLFRLTEDRTGKGRTTRLRPTLNAGAEFLFLDGRFGLGLLSSTRFQEPEALSELTFSANYCPKNWFAAALSFSFLQSGMKTFGLGLKAGPLFVSTDYMVTDRLGSLERANVCLGISLPLGHRKP